MSALSDSEILDQIKKDKKDVLLYLFESNEAALKKALISKGATEEDCHALLEDVLVGFWVEVKNESFILNEGIHKQLQQAAVELWDKTLAESHRHIGEDKYLSEEEKLKKFITTNTTIKYVSYNRGKVGVSIPIFLLISIGVIWFVVQYRPVEYRTIRKFIRIPSISLDNKDKEEDSAVKPSNTYTGSYQQNKTTASEDSTVFLQDSASQDASRNALRMANAEEQEDSLDEEIVVRKDMLLLTKVVKVQNKSLLEAGADTEEKSLTKEITEKLNPEANLPEAETRTKSYLVEFWKSPINFKGYKINKGKIVLFGIDEPEQIKLYSVDNVLYFVYIQNIYKLDNTEEFASFNKIKDTSILSLLK